MACARLGGLDASLLFLEFAHQSMNISTIIELDIGTVPGGYHFDKFHSHLRRRLVALPELRVKLADSAFNLDNPVWVEDPDFDLSRHLHRVQIPTGSSRAEIARVAAERIQPRLDRSRPLWEMWVIECCSASSDVPDRVAVLLKQHHAIMDGASDTDLMNRLCSTEVAAADPAHIAAPGMVSPRQIAIDGVARFARRPAHILRTVLPAFTRAAVASIGRIRSAGTMSSPFRAPAMPFNGNLSAQRTVAYVQLDLAEVKAVKNAFGVKLNDVVLALLAAALRDHQLDVGVTTAKSLVSLVPIAVEERSETGGANQLSAAFCDLQTRITDPVQRLHAIAASTERAKDHSLALGQTLVQDTLQSVSPRLLALALRPYAWSRLGRRLPICNLSVSNVPAPAVQWYLGDARVEGMFGLPPAMYGIGLHVGVSSLNGKLDIGLVSCPHLLPDLWRVADRIPKALNELLVAVG